MQATYPHAVAPFPVRLEGRLDQPSRGLWLVKWLLLLPHYAVLAFLWCALALLSLVAFAAVLFTGDYPRRIFDFNVGVLRWSWRVVFYAFAANGTDRYPPFALGDVPDYPARLEVVYPGRQRRGPALLAWWLLGLPQYLIAAVVAGATALPAGGVIGLLVLVAAFVLLIKGEYPRSIFDLVLGLNRWVLRVAAYAALITPEYPPFRLDGGEVEPGGFAIEPAPSGTGSSVERGRARWGAGRISAVVTATLLVLVGLAALAAGATAVVYDQTQRDANDYLMSGARSYATDTYALVSDSYHAGTSGARGIEHAVVGHFRVRTVSHRPLFVGIGRADAVDSYLTGVRHEIATRIYARPSNFRVVPGAAPAAAPGTKDIWSAQSLGDGTQTLSWLPQSGRWRIVVMNADGSAGVRADVAVGARFPHLLRTGIGAIVGGVFLLFLGAVAICAARRPRPAISPRGET